ncbi:RDD family protein [Corynebacterium ammoniagenes]|uniref:RDD family protein n=1 Tax=Corynebacterium ammoniagenes TaxID=1697 RepID=UPI0014596188|nr:RDD family protein [Corynebacterium ammoniagenes]NMF31138.1 RDD family protein [Corynebacterium ammoniagenes]
MANKKTWLDGPDIPGENDFGEAGRYPGENLGLPESGPGALASVMRRACGVFIDWILCLLVASVLTQFTNILGGTSTATFILWILVGIVGGILSARTPGMAILGMGVARIDVPGTTVGIWRGVVRTLLTACLFPAAMVDADGRGIHDRATGTVVIRS